MTRSQILKTIVEELKNIPCSHPFRVAIDGVDCSGKTTLANELADSLSAFPRFLIRASMDGFHQPREFRYRRGALSPEGYYEDSFNYHALRDYLLSPLGSGGSLQYRKSVFDFRRDSTIGEEVLLAPKNAILLLDGVFLLRPELNDLWDFRIFVDASFEITFSRAKVRDLSLFDTVEEIEKRYLERYIPGQKIYLERVNPKKKAQLVIDNNDPASPIVYRPKAVEIRPISAIQPDVQKLIRELDALEFRLYPRESCYMDSPEKLISENTYFLGAYEKGKLIGMGAIKLFWDYGELKRMYVDPKHRKCAIAEQILRSLETHAKALGLTLIRLETGIRQKEALEFYKKHGFSEVTAFGNYPSDPLSVFMEKSLRDIHDENSR